MGGREGVGVCGRIGGDEEGCMGRCTTVMPDVLVEPQMIGT